MTKTKLDKDNIPKHIAIIMDGNGRWAKLHNRPRVFGHKSGVKSVRSVVEGAAEIGISYLTLYAFSTENWNRPKLEVAALMQLLVEALTKEVAELDKNNVRLQVIGNTSMLPANCRKALNKAIDFLSNNKGLTLVLALSYSSKWEIINAINKIVEKTHNGEIDEEINEQVLEEHLDTKNIPDPELLIRTSGEHRISNFMLWQLAYAEFYFSNILWPDYRKEDLFQAITDYQKRERRFGLTSEQLNKIQ